MHGRRAIALFVVFALVWAAASAFDLGTLGVIAIDLLSVAAVALAWRATARRTELRLAWVLMSAGLTSWLVGDAIWDLYTLRNGEAPSASLADVCYLAGYGFLIAALVTMVLHRAPDRWKDGFLDGVGLAAIASLAAWQFLIDAGSGTLIERTLAAAYPLADALLLAMFAWLALSGGRNGRPTSLMWAGVGGVLVADLALAVTARAGTEWGHSWFNNSYPLAYLLVALALAHPNSGELVRARPSDDDRLHPCRVGFLGLTLFAAPALSTLRDEQSGGVPSWAYLVVTLCVGSLVLARFLHAVREVQAAREALTYQARHDPLTGLFNRASLMTRLTDTLRAAERSGRSAAVLYVDLDRFKPINDTFGHGVGDELLQHVGDRLREVAAGDATVARLGGDEFVVVVDELLESDAQRLASQIVATLVQPFALSHGAVSISASVGVTLSDPGDTPESVLRRADDALYDVKRAGRNGWRLAPLDLGTGRNLVASVPV